VTTPLIASWRSSHKATALLPGAVQIDPDPPRAESLLETELKFLALFRLMKSTRMHAGRIEMLYPSRTRLALEGGLKVSAEWTIASINARDS